MIRKTKVSPYEKFGWGEKWDICRETKSAKPMMFPKMMAKIDSAAIKRKKVTEIKFKIAVKITTPGTLFPGKLA